MMLFDTVVSGKGDASDRFVAWVWFGLSIPYGLTGIGLLRWSNAAFSFGIVLAGLMMLGFPFGTLFGFLMCWALTKTREFYGPERPTSRGM
jgi:hypothetical protein